MLERILKLCRLGRAIRRMKTYFKLAVPEPEILEFRAGDRVYFAGAGSKNEPMRIGTLSHTERHATGNWDGEAAKYDYEGMPKINWHHRVEPTEIRHLDEKAVAKFLAS